MSASDTSHTREQLARLGAEIFDRQVRPALRPEEDGQFVAIDVRSGGYEIDPDDYTAVKRLRFRIPSAEVWLCRAGQSATYRMGGSR